MQIVFFLEERSAKVMLDELLPRILPEGISFKCVPFEGKQDLDRQIEKRLRGWIIPDTAFMILRDQDSSDCRAVKQSLLEKAAKAQRPDTIVRIACHELESWYFGDLQTVGKVFQIDNLIRYSKKSQYRIPDAIINPASELRKITNDGYQKISGSRAIGKEISLTDNTSKSFQVFLQGIQTLIERLSQ